MKAGFFKREDTMLKTLVLCFILLSLIFVSEGDIREVILSCDGAFKPDLSGTICKDIVTWPIARAYDALNFSIYEPGDQLSMNEQADYVKSIYNSLIPEGSHPNSHCTDAIKRYSCVAGYPACALPSPRQPQGINYFYPCRLQCMQLKAACGKKLWKSVPAYDSIDCSKLPKENCMLTLPGGFFVLDQVDGNSYWHLPYLYGILFGIWTIYALYWNYAAFVKHKDTCVPFCRAVAGIPVLKAFVMGMGTLFWSTCISWEMCSFWISVAFINTHLLYEVSVLIAFLLIAQGWTITDENLSPHQWRGVISAASCFYMTNSIILVLDSSVLTKSGTWIANGILYGLMYLYILKSVTVQILTLNSQMNLLRPTMSANIVGPIYNKQYMYIAFLVFVLLALIGEVVTQSLVSRSEDMTGALFCYELTHVIAVGVIGYYFRPQEYSPFFFMIPARVQDTRTRNIPMVEALTATDAEAAKGLYDNPIEIELSRLLDTPVDDMNESSRYFDPMGLPSKMMVIRDAEDSISLGILPVAQFQSAANSGANRRIGQRETQSRVMTRGMEMNQPTADNSILPINLAYMLGRIRTDYDDSEGNFSPSVDRFARIPALSESGGGTSANRNGERMEGYVQFNQSVRGRHEEL